MSMKDAWVINGKVRLHVLTRDTMGDILNPIVFIPGMLGEAEDWIREINNFADERPCFAISLRGRGKSDAPALGYSLQNHVSDINALFETIGLTGATIVAHSRGVPYTLAFALQRPECVKALVLLDHPPLHTPINTKWAEVFSENPPRKSIQPHAIWALQREADFFDFRELLGNLKCPVVYVAGGKEGSMLTREDLEKYSKLLVHPISHVEEDSDHELRTLDLKRILGFLPA
jgi:pimeloyl-ACP methyl ester carboxylesterase